LSEMVDCASTIVSTTFLVYSSWSDLKTREVSNRVWLVFAPIAAIITLFRVLLLPNLLLSSVISVCLTVLLSLVLFYAGFFGGADAKALICIGLANPTPPQLGNFPISSSLPFFPVIVLYNSFFVAVLTVIYALSRNIAWWKRKGHLFRGLEHERFWTKLFALATGYKTDFSELQHKIFLYPLEEAYEEGSSIKRRFRIFVGAEVERDVLVERLTPYVEAGSVPSCIWVTPALPMLVFVTISFLLTSTFGDIAFWVILQFFKHL